MGFINAIVVVVLIQRLGIDSRPGHRAGGAAASARRSGAVNGCSRRSCASSRSSRRSAPISFSPASTLTILPAPTGTVPAWLKALAGPLSIAAAGRDRPVVAGMRQLPYYEHLMAVGSDDRAAYTAGVPVTLVRFIAYVIAGAFAGVAGLMLTALIGSADPIIGPTYTLIAISAVALGGVSLAGGKGGLLGAAIGAIDIFLLQSALTYFNVSTFVLQIAYGTVLVIAIVLTAVQDRLLGRAKGAP